MRLCSSSAPVRPTRTPCARCASCDPGAHVVIVAPDDRRSGELRRLLRAGADAVVFDGQAEACLALTVRAVHAGQIVVPARARQHVVRQPLSHREKQILRLVVRGFTNRQIADELYLAESTVKTHLSSAFTKLDTHSRAEVTALILDPDEGRGLDSRAGDGRPRRLARPVRISPGASARTRSAGGVGCSIVQ